MNFEQVSYFSQTWGLVYLVAVFVGVLVYALWPSSREKFDNASRIPLRED